MTDKTSKIFEHIDEISSLVDIDVVIRYCKEKENLLQRESAETKSKKYLREKYAHNPELVRFVDDIKLKSFHRKKNGSIGKYGYEIEICFDDSKTKTQNKLSIWCGNKHYDEEPTMYQITTQEKTNESDESNEKILIFSYAENSAIDEITNAFGFSEDTKKEFGGFLENMSTTFSEA
jgi:hypothetical protein